MIFEIILLRLVALLLVCLLLFWLGAVAWKAFNKNKKFDTFTKTINEQPEGVETPSAEEENEVPAVPHPKKPRRGTNQDQAKI